MCDFGLIFVAVRKPSLTSNPPQIVHPPHLYTNTAATVIHHYPGQVGHPGGHHHALPASAASSETATYVNINRPAFPPNNLMHNHHTQHRPPVIHPGSAGHVPYSPAFHHHQHVRPVGIAMPRQGESFQRQSSVGNALNLSSHFVVIDLQFDICFAVDPSCVNFTYFTSTKSFSGSVLTNFILVFQNRLTLVSFRHNFVKLIK